MTVTQVDDDDIVVSEKQAKIAELQKDLSDFLANKRAAVVEDVKAKVAKYHITASEIGLAEKPSKNPRARRSKVELQAARDAKHEKAVKEAKQALEKGCQVTKYTDEKTGRTKYHFEGKKGGKPKGEGVAVTAVDQIV